jgi:hypothetical protein
MSASGVFPVERRPPIHCSSRSSGWKATASKPKAITAAGSSIMRARSSDYGPTVTCFRLKKVAPIVGGNLTTLGEVNPRRLAGDAPRIVLW